MLLPELDSLQVSERLFGHGPKKEEKKSVSEI